MTALAQSPPQTTRTGPSESIGAYILSTPSVPTSLVCIECQLMHQHKLCSLDTGAEGSRQPPLTTSLELSGQFQLRWPLEEPRRFSSGHRDSSRREPKAALAELYLFGPAGLCLSTPKERYDWLEKVRNCCLHVRVRAVHHRRSSRHMQWH